MNVFAPGMIFILVLFIHWSLTVVIYIIIIMLVMVMVNRLVITELCITLHLLIVNLVAYTIEFIWREQRV